MSDDASIQDFLDAGDTETATDGDESVASGEDCDESVASDQHSDEPVAEDDDTEDQRASVTPARSTAAWSPDGGPCQACGATASRRWTGPDGLVCPTCKEW